MTNKEIRELLGWELHTEHVSVRKGVWTVKRYYFYHIGYSPEKLADKIKSLIPTTKILDCIDDWHAWPKSSYFVVKFALA